MENEIDIGKYKQIFENIKQEVLKSQYKAMQIVNKELIFMYWHIGKIIGDNSKWGNKFIDSLSIDLKLEFPKVTGFSVRNLKYMKKIAEEYPDFEFVQQVVAQIPWGHNIILMDKVKNIEERKWYIKQSIINGWSRSLLTMQIESKLYERQVVAEKVTNFPATLPDIQSDLAIQTMKDPYLFDFISLKGKVKEIEIEKAMIDKIKDVLIELGKGFAFVGEQYKITVSEKDYYIDLLFYHVKLHCYVVVELKTEKFKPEFAGQLNFYVTAVNKNMKDEQDNQTIGILICKDKDDVVAEYSLENISQPIGIAQYELTKVLRKEFKSSLPTIEEIEEGLSE